MGEIIIARNQKVENKIDISSATVTLASGALTYDGTLKTQTVSSVVVNGQTLTANTDYTVINNAYTNAGNYTLTVQGVGNYKGQKNVSWSISKATGSVSVSPSSMTIIGMNETSTATVTIIGDGAISVNSSDNTIATASVSGTTVTVTSAVDGSATITVTLDVGVNYTGDSATISVNVVTISATLSENTPSQIQAAARAGVASTLWSVGAQTAEISIGAIGDGFSDTTACAFIIGFDHNSSKEGTNRIHFQFGKTTDGTDIAFCDSGYVKKTSGTWFNMNNSATNSGGWGSSRMRTTICTAFKSALPSAWQSVVSITAKYTDNAGDGSDTAAYVTMTNDDIFLLAEFEVFGKRTYANSAEQDNQTQYDYYKNGNSKVKYKSNGTSTTCFWWLRSPGTDSTNNFCRVSTSGYVGSIEATYSRGFAPGFCVA